MCTILILNEIHEEFPLLIAANRDEFYKRETTGIQLLHDHPGAIGGLDGKRGGTWMGANARGIFAGITNQRTYIKDDPHRESRGKVVLDALKCSTTEEIEGMLRTLDGRSYNAFNLLFGSAGELKVAYARREHEQLQIQEVPKGISILPNDIINSTIYPKVKHMRGLIEESALSSLSTIEELTELMHGWLGEHHKPPLSEVPRAPKGSLAPRIFLRELEAMCIHTPNYGTRSSTIVALKPHEVARYLYCEGHPCKHSFEDVTHLLK